MTDSSTASQMNALVGRHIRQARLENRITAASLAARTGITPQQLSKFERGLNRIHAEQIWLFAQALGRPVDWFFEAQHAFTSGRRVGRKTQELFEILEILEPENLRLIAGAARMLADARLPANKRPRLGARGQPSMDDNETLSGNSQRV